MAPRTEPEEQNRERILLLKGLVETVMIVLGFVWIGLLVIEFAYGLSPFLSIVFNVIWVIFILDFLVELAFARDKLRYLRANWLTGLSLAIPAIRILRVFRVIRVFRLASVIRGIRLVRLITSFTRSARALGRTMRRRGFGYVIALTLIVAVAGAAGMYTFERNTPDQQGFDSYGEALWWTAMIITTLGSQYWPVTVEGRILCLLLSIYAFTVFGYITASLASHFIDRDAPLKLDQAGTKAMQALHAEIAALREEARQRHSQG